MLNIIYVQRLTKSLKCQFIFTHDVCQIQEKLTLKTIGQAEIKDGLYHMHGDKKDSLVNFVLNEVVFKTAEKLDVGWIILRKKVLQHLTKTHNDIHFNHDNICSPCHLAKHHNLPFQLSKSFSKFVFDLIHIDIRVPFGVPSIPGHRYFLTIIDDFSRHTWVHLMKNKSETIDLLQHFIVHVKNQFDKSIKTIRMDNGKEFC